MENYEYQYMHNGTRFNLPTLENPKLTLHTGQGHHSSSSGRGSMSMVAHIVSRLLLGQAQRTDQGFLDLEFFKISRLGMLILQKCADHSTGQQVIILRILKSFSFSKYYY